MHLLGRIALVLTIYCTAHGASALADEATEKRVAESALREARDHCGVPVGHVFDGRLQLLLAVDRAGSWRAVSPHWRSRREYPLQGYLLLEGRDKEGYVLFPK